MGRSEGGGEGGREVMGVEGRADRKWGWRGGRMGGNGDRSRHAVKAGEGFC